jgi:hypothetical protein
VCTRLVCRTGRPGRFRGDPDTLAGSAFMRYVGPLTGADRAEHYVALARLERRQQRVAAAMGSAGQLIKTQYLTVPTILLAFAPVLMMSSPVGREQQCSSNAQAPRGPSTWRCRACCCKDGFETPQR